MRTHAPGVRSVPAPAPAPATATGTGTGTGTGKDANGLCSAPAVPA